MILSKQELFMMGLTAPGLTRL